MAASSKPGLNPTSENPVIHHVGLLGFVSSRRATSHMIQRACDHYTSSTLIGGKGEASPSSLRTTLEGQTEQDGCKVYMDSYMALNGSYFMVTWTIYKNHPLEVDLTQNRETMTIRTDTNIGLLALSVGRRLCIDFFFSKANFLTTLHSHLDVTCSC